MLKAAQVAVVVGSANLTVSRQSGLSSDQANGTGIALVSIVR